MEELGVCSSTLVYIQLFNIFHNNVRKTQAKTPKNCKKYLVYEPDHLLQLCSKKIKDSAKYFVFGWT